MGPDVIIIPNHRFLVQLCSDILQWVRTLNSDHAHTCSGSSLGAKIQLYID